MVSRHFNKYLAKRKSVIHDVVAHTTHLLVKEALPKNFNQLLIATNPNSDVLHMIQSERVHLSQRIDTLEKITLKMNEKLEKIIVRNKECK